MKVTKIQSIFSDNAANGTESKKNLVISKYLKEENKLRKYIGELILSEIEDLQEKYLEKNKVFTAVHNLEDYNIEKGDRVKITGTELANGFFGIKNLRTGEELRIYSLEFIKNFR